MKPIWLIETGVWKDDNVPRMITILRELGIIVYAVPYSQYSAAEFEGVNEDAPVIFYGTINTVEQLRVSRPNWVPLSWFDSVAFSCRSYYAHWGRYLLHDRYGFYPLGELARLKDQLYETYGKQEMVFIRPDENNKSFSGRLVPSDNFPQWHAELQASNMDPATMAVVAEPAHPGGEWRFVVADQKVISGTYYKWAGELFPSPEDLQTAGRLAQEITAESWQPRAIYCVDVTRNRAGQYRLVEIGGINSAGLYHCDLLPIIQAMNEIAVREYRHWKGLASGKDGDRLESGPQ